MRSAGFDVIRYRPDQLLMSEFPEMETWEKNVIEASRPYTMTSVQRQWALISALKYVERRKVPGDIVECGVWKGGNLILSGLVGRKLASKRRIWAFDTFEGMPEPTELDRLNYDNTPGEVDFAKHQQAGKPWIYAPIEEVTSNIRKSGLDLADFRFVKGKCEETMMEARNLPDRIAVLRLDTDWYESTKVELEILFPRLAQHGVLIIDDYGHWSGAKKAVDEYFEDNPVLMSRVDYSGRMVVKI